MRKHVIVTGNLGYLGPIVVKRLKDRGYVTVGVDIELYDAVIPYECLPEIQVAKVTDLPDYLWDPTAVVHLAGLSNDVLGEIAPSATYAVNTRMAADLTAIFNDAKHVYASSASVYGSGNPSGASSESDIVEPLTTYADSKVKAERLIDFINPNAALLRFATLWGDSPNFRVDTVVNAFAIEAAKTNSITPKSNAKRPLLHVSDAADAIVKVIESPREEYVGAYNVLGENAHVFDIAHKLAAKLNCEVKIDESLKDADARSYFIGTFKSPHLVPSNPITLNSDEFVNRLFATAKMNLDKWSRIADYKARLQWLAEEGQLER